MNIETYLRKRSESLKEVSKRRTLCLSCFQPDFSCYCESVRTFDSNIKFVILIHPIEARRRIATGRMSHLCLKNSELILGHDYSHHERVNEIIAHPDHQSFVLYPGPHAINLSRLSPQKRADHFSSKKELVIFVIDGTWNTARKTMYRSQNLSLLPRICFTPHIPSRFRVRKQPAPECYSTLEAIHQTIELLGPVRGFDIQTKEHDNLLEVFRKMVERQLDFIENKNPISRHSARLGK